MSLDLVTSVLDWSQQSRDFRADGTVRDIFIANTTLEDWRAVLDVIFRPEHRAALMARGAVEDLPRELSTLFRRKDPYLLSFQVSGVEVNGDFVDPSIIELWFQPREVTEPSMGGILAFLVEIGERTHKMAVVSAENSREPPIYRYSTDPPNLEWIPPLRPHRET